MINKKWIDIIQLKEFIEYFKIGDLIELSSSSKLFRSKLIPAIYKTLKFDYFKMKKFEYNGYIITENDIEYNEKDIEERVQHYRRENHDSDDEEFDDSIDFFINPYKPLSGKFIASREKFKSDLNLIPHQPRKIIIQSVFYESYLFRNLPITFNNLKALHIVLIWITFEDLQYLLDNLECLEDLQFTNSYIFKRRPESVDSSINWPQTLKKLAIGGNKEMQIDRNEDPILIHPHNYYPDIPSTQHLLIPVCLPNLESLSLKPLEEEFVDKLEFLKANPYIKRLLLPLVDEIPQVFDIIKSFNKLEHLCIFTNIISSQNILESINSSMPPNLKNLTIDIDYYTDIIQLLNKSFHRITNLKVKFNFLHFNQLLTFINKLQDMQSLKKLKLCFGLTSSEFDESKGYPVDKPFRTNIITFPKLGNLESVEFESKSITHLKIDLSQLKLRIDECQKLKCIGFRSEDNLKFYGKIGLDKLELGDNWKLISTPRRYLLYKASQ